MANLSRLIDPITKNLTTDVEIIFNTDQFDTVHEDEWEGELDPTGHSRLNEEAWVARYDYESKLIDQVLELYPNIKNVLELGSCPGVLSQKILEKHPDLNYHLVDKPFAEEYFKKHKFKGKFFVRDLSSNFDTSGLLDKYDLVITNDFLEHIFNPSIIVQTIYNLTHKDSIYFISNPNWRMGHQWVYRGLFDFDNFLYFLYTHKFKFVGMWGSILQTPFYPRISSETLLQEKHLFDWNHYLLFQHRTKDFSTYDL